MRRRRKVSTVMFTDIEGYTALMQRDEEEGIRIRDRHREIFQPVTEKYGGEIIQYFGDGTLSIFDDARDAVRCGIELQMRFLEKPAIPVRIGMHKGYIVLDEYDIIGDAVNIASRVESLAEAGSVLLSTKVFEELQESCDVSLISLGKFRLKNDAKERELFAVEASCLRIPTREKLLLKVARPKASNEGDQRQFIMTFLNKIWRANRNLLIFVSLWKFLESVF